MHLIKDFLWIPIIIVVTAIFMTISDYFTEVVKIAELETRNLEDSLEDALNEHEQAGKE